MSRLEKLKKSWKPPSESEMRSKFGVHFKSPLIEIKIGQEPNVNVLQVHEAALTKASQYFKGCMRFGGVEQETRSITLADEVDDPDAFYLFLQIAYNGGLSPAYEPDQKLEEDELVLLAKLYALGDRLQSDSTRTVAFDLLKGRLGSGSMARPSFYVKDLMEAVQIIYQDTPVPKPIELAPRADSNDGSSDSESEDEITEDTTNVKASRKIRSLFIEHFGYAIKTVRTDFREEFGELIRACDREFLVDLLLNEDIVSDKWSRVEKRGPVKPALVGYHT